MYIYILACTYMHMICRGMHTWKIVTKHALKTVACVIHECMHMHIYAYIYYIYILYIFYYFYVCSYTVPHSVTHSNVFKSSSAPPLLIYIKLIRRGIIIREHIPKSARTLFFLPQPRILFTLHIFTNLDDSV
jgi:hypothetical protein